MNMKNGLPWRRYSLLNDKIADETLLDTSIEETDDEKSVASTFSMIEANILKEIVPPIVYDLDCKLSLPTFLKDFERYFSYKYIGNDRDRCRVLGNFLSGEVLKVFEVLGGTHVAYSDVKDKLLTWYDSQRVVMKQRAKSEFKMAFLKESENLTLYCLRLEVLADSAYPRDSRKAFKRLKKHLFVTLPDYAINALEERMELKDYLSLGSLTWTDILEVVAKLDRKIFKQSFNERKCKVIDRECYPPVESSPVTNETKSDIMNLSSNSVHDKVEPLVSVNKEKEYVIKNSLIRDEKPVEILNKKGRGRCYRCKIFGHYRVDCTVRVVYCNDCCQFHHRDFNCSLVDLPYKRYCLSKHR